MSLLDRDDGASRREFLKAAGFSLAGVAAGACSRPPVEHALPFVQAPDGITPGRPYAYATTCGACEARCGLLVTNRDGRPIKIEGNPDHPLSNGATCAVGQASVLGLYDGLRLTHPLLRGGKAGWPGVDRAIVAALDRIRQEGGAVRILTGTINSPTLASVIGEFAATFTNVRHVSYDPISASAMLDANFLTHGTRAIPRYHLDRAEMVVGLDADYLGTWISPVEFARQDANRRRPPEERDERPAADPPEGIAPYHVQIESRLSLTGTKADRRLRVAPADMAHLATWLASRISVRAGTPVWEDTAAPSAYRDVLDDVAERLWRARGRSVVLVGSDDLRVQLLGNFINHLVGAYGATIDLSRPSFQRRGSDRDLAALGDELARGDVAAIVIAGVNPVFDLPDGSAFAEHLRRVPLLVCAAERLDETSSLAHYVCPDHHYLESWGDAEAVSGIVSLQQPAIHPIGETRSLIESLAAWSGRPRSSREAIVECWRRDIHPRAASADPFDTFWDRTLERGVVEVTPQPVDVKPFDASAVQPVTAPDRPPEGGSHTDASLALILHPTIAMLDGRHGHNAWLHELPDPVTKVTWDNYAALSAATARALGVADGDVVRLTPGDHRSAIEVPAFIQPGQHDAVVSVALGYGRQGTERFTQLAPIWIGARNRATPVGVNAAPLSRVEHGYRRVSGSFVTVVRTGRTHRLASTQLHHTLDQRRGRRTEPAHERDLWPQDHKYPGTRWGMAIDLNACTGCSACVIACQAENNIPVVGQDEVFRQREMHWIRIDRYYADDDDRLDVLHQPMLCQHCENAPCETVCPVLATVHSSEGLNDQIYNRCVGTRYCENNCPYKVRRFNWFEYPREDRLQNLALNPNVTVRSRGVMEKCTFCVQRIEETKIEARQRGVPVHDGDVQTACQQVCPAQAIVFGNLNDPDSRVARAAAGPRSFRSLESLNTRPAVHYLEPALQRPLTLSRDV